jgi:hypothetical protein
MKDLTTTMVIVMLSTPSGEQVTLNDIEVTASDLHTWPKPAPWAVVPAAVTRAVKKRVYKMQWLECSYEAGTWHITVHGQLKSCKKSSTQRYNRWVYSIVCVLNQSNRSGDLLQ